MGYSRKNPNRGFENIEFPGVSKKYHVELPGQGLIKNEVEFSRVTKKI